MTDLDLPFQADYAITGRAGCKGCKQKIDQGALRIALMVQSPFHVGKQPNWHHEECFFKKQHPNSINDIGNFNKLKSEDQERIKSIMGSDLDVENSTGNSKKRAADDAVAESTNIALNDYLIEYSKTNRATCRHCETKICKDEVRISKAVFFTELGTKIGGQPWWHHVKCFAEKRRDFHYFAGGESLPGFKNLSKEDQALVTKEIPPLKADEVPVKKLKVEPKSEEELKEEKEKEKKLEKQNNLYFKYRNALSELAKVDLEVLLEVNLQEIPSGKDECLDRLADCMAFGILEPCTECKHGQLVLDTFGYKCTGNISEWTKCSHVTQNPKRAPMIVPEAFKDRCIFKEYKPLTDVRLFESERVPLLVVVKAEPVAREPTVKQEEENGLVIQDDCSLHLSDSSGRRSPADVTPPPTPPQDGTGRISRRSSSADVIPPHTPPQVGSGRISDLSHRQSVAEQNMSHQDLPVGDPDAEAMLAIAAQMMVDAAKTHAEAAQMQAQAANLLADATKSLAAALHSLRNHN